MNADMAERCAEFEKLRAEIDRKRDYELERLREIDALSGGKPVVNSCVLANTDRLEIWRIIAGLRAMRGQISTELGNGSIGTKWIAMLDRAISDLSPLALAPEEPKWRKAK